MGNFNYAAKMAEYLHKEHCIPKERAIKIATQCYLRKKANSGMGQTEVMEHIAKAKEQISPWLWVFSIAGFGMALLNTKRVSKMFKTWKKGRAS